MARLPEFPIVWARNLPYRASVDSLYELFGSYGAIHQIRMPTQAREILGTCMVIYSSLENAKTAARELNGVNFEGRYLVTSIFQVNPSTLAEVKLEARL